MLLQTHLQTQIQAHAQEAARLEAAAETERVVVRRQQTAIDGMAVAQRELEAQLMRLMAPTPLADAPRPRPGRRPTAPTAARPTRETLDAVGA